MCIYMYIDVCVYIYIYIYIYCKTSVLSPQERWTHWRETKTNWQCSASGSPHQLTSS